MNSFAIVVFLLASLSWQSQEKTRDKTLTSAEVSDGWLLLFDGATTFGWKIDGQAKIENGVLVLGGEKETRAQVTLELEGFQISLDADWDGEKPPKLLTTRLVLDAAEKGKFSRVKYVTASAGHAECVLAAAVPAGTRLMLRNIKLKPTKMRSIFNGKDLTGWKEYPGKRSKVSVAEGGAINLKDGPGDLQTTEKFADFILQLECISHGKHLNSGVFFRCRAGEYQNGYEAQIRNQFTTEPTQEYVLEEYDPETHKLVAKTKAKFTAVDYGTGAIYRRQPARKEVAKDGEWFTLTILAHGNHLATWVNGIQVTDWLDHRPLADNARTGCRLEAGHISFQGHDPTTNLSFRNIRLAPF